MELERALQNLESQFAELAECVDPADIAAHRRIRGASLPNAVLLKMVRENPPPQEWFESEEEEPFWVAR